MSTWFGSWLTDPAEALVHTLLKAERFDHDSPLSLACGLKHNLCLSRSLAVFERLLMPCRVAKRSVVDRVAMLFFFVFGVGGLNDVMILMHGHETNDYDSTRD